MSKPSPSPRDRASSSSHSAPSAHPDNLESGSPQKTEKPPKPVAPTKAETALLPPFPGLTLEQIHVPTTQAECQSAVAEIIAAGIAGFDTEAKPIFRKGQKCNGPHLVQFALTDKAFLFQLHNHECEKASAELIASKQVLKVGFGLKNDHGQIKNRLNISLTHVLDLDQTFRQIGYRGQIGVRGAVGVILHQCFKKSKATTTSNWALPELSSRQLLYAANDAFAAIKIMEALQKEGLLKSE